MAKAALCKVAGCIKTVTAKGLCSTHYSRLRTNGSAYIVKVPKNGTLPQWIRDHVDWGGDGCLIWPFSRNPNGYACQVSMDGRKVYAHDHMCRLAHGDKPSPKHEVAHSCGHGRQGCVHPGHIRWATRKENMVDMMGHGRTTRGTRSCHQRLTEDEVRQIRRAIGTKPQREIAEDFGVSQQEVSNIHTRKKWAWLV